MGLAGFTGLNQERRSGYEFTIGGDRSRDDGVGYDKHIVSFALMSRDLLFVPRFCLACGSGVANGRRVS